MFSAFLTVSYFFLLGVDGISAFNYIQYPAGYYGDEGKSTIAFKINSEYLSGDILKIEVNI